VTGPDPVLETARLSLRRLSAGDVEFLLELLNEAPFLRNVGDKGVRTADDARRYVLEGPVASYERFGFGLYRVDSKESGEPVGICGLLKRDSLEDVDIGFALLERHWSRGYACEAASAVMDFGRTVIGLKRIVAITTPDNHGSIKVLEKIGLRFERIVSLPDLGGDKKLFARDF